MVVNHELIAKNIIKYRTSGNISQRVLAEKIGVAPATLSSIECNRMKASITLLLKIAENLNISIDYLFEGNLKHKQIDLKTVSNSDNEFSDKLRVAGIKHKEFLLDVLSEYSK